MNTVIGSLDTIAGALAAEHRRDLDREADARRLAALARGAGPVSRHRTADAIRAFLDVLAHPGGGTGGRHRPSGSAAAHA